MAHLWDETLRPFMERNFSMLLLLAFFIGLIMPDISFIPKIAVPTILAAIIFISCSKISVADFKQFRVRDVAGFVALRFLLLPVVFFFIAQAVVPEYKYALLMLGLLPCGVTLAALMGIVGGSAALGLTATTITSFLVLGSIPLAFGLLSGVSLELNIWGMFQTLVFMVVCPVVLYFGLARRYEPLKLVMRRNSSALSCILICINVVIVISYQQSKFFENFGFIFLTLLIGGLAYLLFFIIGWNFFPKGTRKQKISYALMSGNNNINLGISLAVLFMPDHESLILILWELSWILGLVFFELFLRKTGGNAQVT